VVAIAIVELLIDQVRFVVEDTLQFRPFVPVRENVDVPPIRDLVLDLLVKYPLPARVTV
jgi:hypothetical protein